MSCPDHFILICATCRGNEDAARVRAALSKDLPAGYGFRAVDCMAGCDHPMTVGFQAAGKASYLFGGIETADDVQALGRFAIQFRQSRTGWTSSTERPAALSDKTLARLPAFRSEANA